MEALELEIEGQRVLLTLSAGVAAFPDLFIKTVAELILFTGEALYEAKRQGRNRCLLDIGQGRYLDIEGNLLTTEEVQPAVEVLRISCNPEEDDRECYHSLSFKGGADDHQPLVPRNDPLGSSFPRRRSDLDAFPCLGGLPAV